MDVPTLPALAAFAAVLTAFAFARARAKPAWNLIGRPWGVVDEKIVTLFTLSNNHLTVDISNYGGTISRLLVKGKDGTQEDVVLGYNKLEDFVKGKMYFGAICGRSANRIANGKFTIGGTDFLLAKNAGNAHHLHGGVRGFDRKVWEVLTACVGEHGPELSLKYLSPDGEEGYPGNLEVIVHFTLIEDRLAIEFSAVSDHDTVVNLTHHAYFNLAGHNSGSIEYHRLRINAEAYTPVDESLVPTGEVRPVEGTPFDFRQRKEIGRDLKSAGGDPKGYDHNFVITNRFGTLCEAAEVTDPKSLRRLIVETDAPGLQLYTSNFITSEPGKDGAVYRQYQALCLEAQSFPDAVNKANFPTTVVKQGQAYNRRIHFVFPRASSW
jgi:aldose 1-epimerase